MNNPRIIKRPLLIVMEEEDGSQRIELWPPAEDFDPLCYALIAADLFRQVAHFADTPVEDLVDLLQRELAVSTSQAQYSEEMIGGTTHRRKS